MLDANISTQTQTLKSGPLVDANEDGYMAAVPPHDGSLYFMLGAGKFTGGNGKPWEYWRASRDDWHTIFTHHTPSAFKAAISLVPGVLEIASTRNTVAALYFLIYDIDNKEGCQSFDEVSSIMKSRGIAAALYTSYNHEVAGRERFRVVIPLEEPFPVKGSFAIWASLYKIVGKALGLHFDPATADAPRVFYLPTHPPGATNARATVVEGSFFDWQPYLAEAEENVTVKASAPAPARHQFIRKGDLDEVKGALSSIPPDCGYGTWRDIIWAVKHGFGASQLAYDALDAWSSNGDSYNPSLLQSIWDGGKADGAITMGTFWYHAREHGYVRRRRAQDADIEFIDDDEDMFPLFGEDVDEEFAAIRQELLSTALSARDFARRFYEAFPLSFLLCDFLGVAQSSSEANPTENKPFRWCRGERQTIDMLTLALEKNFTTRDKMLNLKNFDKNTLGFDLARMEYAQ